MKFSTNKNVYNRTARAEACVTYKSLLLYYRVESFFIKSIERAIEELSSTPNTQSSNLYIYILYVQEVVTQPKILNQTIYPILFMWPKIILLCKQIIFNLKYRNN